MECADLSALCMRANKAVTSLRTPNNTACAPARLLFRQTSLILPAIHWRNQLMKILVSLLIAVTLMTVTIAAQKQKPKPCEDAQTQADMNICWGNEYKKADAALNKSYQQLAGMLNDDEKVQLKTAETAWLKYRDANCEFVGDQYKGGSMRPMIVAMCLADVTSNRTTEIKNQIKDRNQ